MFSSVGHGSAFDIAGNGIADPDAVLRCSSSLRARPNSKEYRRYVMTFRSPLRRPTSHSPARTAKPFSTRRSAPAMRCPIPAAKASASCEAALRQGRRRQRSKEIDGAGGQGPVLPGQAAKRHRDPAAANPAPRSAGPQDDHGEGLSLSRAGRRCRDPAAAFSGRHSRQVQGRAVSARQHARWRRAQFLDGQCAARERRRAVAHPARAGRAFSDGVLAACNWTTSSRSNCRSAISICARNDKPMRLSRDRNRLRAAEVDPR